MQLQDIPKIIGIQGITVTGYSITTQGEIHINIEPENYIQPCPCCHSLHVIRNGRDGNRRVRHLPLAEVKCILIMPKVRLKCKSCRATYAYEYAFIDGKQRYTKRYKMQIYQQAIGSTVQHVSETSCTPYSSAERFFKEIVMRVAPVTEAYAQKQAQDAVKLILGIDDFAIRKGHRYNTGIHDLRGESLLDIVEGRKLPELRAYMKKNPQMAALKPFAIVMDLAKAYHRFAKEYFPDAIRVADRFHVNRYIMDAINEIRRRVEEGLAPQARLNLKRQKHLLNKRNDSLDDAQRKQLQALLKYSTDLKAAYELKERFIQWYDCSPNYETAKASFQRFLDEGRALNIKEIDKCLKTYVNWQNEIVNYHRCCFTNGIVEGRNGKIKSIQRRRFFARNRSYYECIIIIECNKEIAHEQFKSLFA